MDLSTLAAEVFPSFTSRSLLRQKCRVIILFHLFVRFCHQSKSHILDRRTLRVEDARLPETRPPAQPTAERELPKLNLTNLPPEIIIEILSHLSTSSLVALKLTSRELFLRTPVPPTGWMTDATRCDKTAVRRYMNERRDLAAGRRQCLICNLVAPLDRYSQDLPVCKWHDAWFRSTSVPEHLDSIIQLRLQAIARSRRSPVWVPIPRTFCLHTANVVGWHVKECQCDCDSCGHFAVTCFARVSNKRDGPVQAQPSEDGLYMTEEHWMLTTGGSMQSYYKNTPIIPIHDL